MGLGATRAVLQIITTNIEKQINNCKTEINSGTKVDENKMTLVDLLVQIEYYKDKMYSNLYYEKDSFSKMQHDTSNTNRVNADEILFNNLQNYCNDNIISSNSEYFKFKTQTFTHRIPPVTQTYEDYFNKMKEYYKTTNVHKIGMGAPNLLMTNIGSLSKVSIQQVNSTETPRQQPITPVVSTKQASFSVVDTK